MFYTFTQFADGGRLHQNPIEGLGAVVVIEADDARTAAEKLVALGGYFDGLRRAVDSEADRWVEVTDGTKKAPKLTKQDVPSFVHYADGSVLKV